MDKMIAIVFLVVVIATYPRWSWKQWSYRCERDVIPFTGKKEAE